MKTEKFLEDSGFQNYGVQSNESVLWQKRITNTEYVCQTNDNLHINVHYFDFTKYGLDRKSAEIEICAEANDGEWYKLMAYGIAWRKLPVQFKEIERKLLKAWYIVNQGD